MARLPPLLDCECLSYNQTMKDLTGLSGAVFPSLNESADRLLRGNLPILQYGASMAVWRCTDSCCMEAGTACWTRGRQASWISTTGWLSDNSLLTDAHFAAGFCLKRRGVGSKVTAGGSSSDGRLSRPSEPDMHTELILSSQRTHLRLLN